MRISIRIGWKPVFYGGILPLMRRLGASRCDAMLTAMGRVVSSWPSRRRAQRHAIGAASKSLDATWDLRCKRQDLSRNVARFAARDCPLDGLTDADALARFSFDGWEHLEDARASGRGVILLGCHFGAYLAGLHGLMRRGVPIRLFAQKPSHVSGYLQSMLHRDAGPHPQSRFFLRRHMNAGEGAERLVRARAALRDGLVLYLCGDIPWPSSHARPGRFLGQDLLFQSVWADLAAITGAVIVPVFSYHEPGGRYFVRFEPPYAPDPLSAVPHYLARLESEIVARPHEAVAYLTWPCYQGSRPSRLSRRDSRSSTVLHGGARRATAHAANLDDDGDGRDACPRGAWHPVRA